LAINLTHKDVDSLPPGLMQKPAPGSFKTPSGKTYTPGDQVTHSSGAAGTVLGQHPDTGRAVIDWHGQQTEGLKTLTNGR
jgi:hypothetical protein